MRARPLGLPGRGLALLLLLLAVNGKEFAGRGGNVSHSHSLDRYRRLIPYMTYYVAQGLQDPLRAPVLLPAYLVRPAAPTPPQPPPRALFRYDHRSHKDIKAQPFHPSPPLTPDNKDSEDYFKPVTYRTPPQSQHLVVFPEDDSRSRAKLRQQQQRKQQQLLLDEVYRAKQQQQLYKLLLLQQQVKQREHIRIQQEQEQIRIQQEQAIRAQQEQAVRAQKAKELREQIRLQQEQAKEIRAQQELRAQIAAQQEQADELRAQQGLRAQIAAQQEHADELRAQQGLRAQIAAQQEHADELRAQQGLRAQIAAQQEHADELRAQQGLRAQIAAQQVLTGRIKATKARQELQEKYRLNQKNILLREELVKAQRQQEAEQPLSRKPSDDKEPVVEQQLIVSLEEAEKMLPVQQQPVVYAEHQATAPQKVSKGSGSSSREIVAHLINGLQLSNKLPQSLTPDNFDMSLKTIIQLLRLLHKTKAESGQPAPVAPTRVKVSPEAPETDTAFYIGEGSVSQTFPAPSKEGSTPGRPGIDYPAYDSIPQTSFSCATQRYKGFFGDPETNCQVWHYCDLNGGQASFLCPNGTIFSQVGLTCDWWFNVRCASTAQLYVLNERLYKYILPVKPSFPEDFSGPDVDRYLTEKFREMQAKARGRKEKTAPKEGEGPNTEEPVPEEKEKAQAESAATATDTDASGPS